MLDGFVSGSWRLKLDDSQQLANLARKLEAVVIAVRNIAVSASLGE